MGLGLCMPREAWRLPSPQPLQKNSVILASAMTLSECLFFFGRQIVWGEGNLQASLGMHDPNHMNPKTSPRNFY